MSDYLAAKLQGIPPSQACQAFFALSSGLVGLIQALPSDLRGALMDYGARRPGAATDGSGSGSGNGGGRNALSELLAGMTNYGQVPHSWFLHFYIVSTSWSAFWAWQLLTRGDVMGRLARAQDKLGGGQSMEMGQVIVALGLMAAQGSRRLYESLYVSKPGKTPMWFVHWALGLCYYTAMGMSVWIEGSGAILKHWHSPQPYKLFSPKVASSAALFFLAWYNQNKCHRHLASLKKYTLPEQGAFRHIVCPHYTFECLLYVALAMAAAPPGKVVNKTVLSGLLFVAVNLGATARGTKKWYAEKFGDDKVANKWRMIPFLF